MTKQEMTLDEVTKFVSECEGNHVQQVAYSSFHKGITQVCFGCDAVRTSIKTHKPANPEGLWKPKDGEKYWFLTMCGDIEDTKYTDSYFDRPCIEIGNVYRTQEAAQKELDKRIALQEMREYIASCDIGWNGVGEKFMPCIGAIGIADFILVQEKVSFQPDNLYLDRSFKSFLIDQADNIRKYFGV